MAIFLESSKDSLRESKAQRFVSALIVASAVLAGQLLLPGPAHGPSYHGPHAPEDTALVTIAQVPRASHGYDFARPDSVYTDENIVHRMAFSPNGASSEVEPFMKACACGPWSLPDSLMIAIVMIFVLFGFAVSCVDVREMLDQDRDEATHEFPFSAPFVGRMLIVVELAIFVTVFESLFDQILAMAGSTTAWVACCMQHAPAASLQFSRSFVDGVWSLLDKMSIGQPASALPDSVMIVLIIVFLLLGSVVARNDVYEMSEENTEAAVNGFEFPRRLIIFLMLIVSGVPGH